MGTMMRNRPREDWPDAPGAARSAECRRRTAACPWLLVRGIRARPVQHWGPLGQVEHAPTKMRNWLGGALSCPVASELASGAILVW